jgi:hypothetical protein
VLSSHQLVPRILQADRDAIGAGDTYDDAYFEKFLANIKPVLEQQLAGSISATASAIISAWTQAGRPELREAGTRPVQKVKQR